MATRLPLTRRGVLAVLLVGALVLAAGCAGIDDQSSETETPTTDDPTTEVQTGTTEIGDSDTTEPGEHDHNETSETVTTADDAAATGKMAVVVAGSRLDLDEEYGSSEAFWVNNGSYDVWHRSEETVTLADALSTFGIEATTNSLTYAGTTYEDDTDGTHVNVRVNGEEVEPESYELQDGDEIWVTVETPDANASVPGEHISHEDLHVHGNITFSVDGEEANFSQNKYQNSNHSRHFHFENGAADPWHAHSWSVTLGYGMATLEGIDVSVDSVTYENETYVDSENGASVTIEVNGEPVDPDEYFLKDGDSIQIVVETND